jgi:hypothetical protein
MKTIFQKMRTEISWRVYNENTTKFKNEPWHKIGSIGAISCSPPLLANYFMQPRSMNWPLEIIITFALYFVTMFAIDIYYFAERMAQPSVLISGSPGSKILMFSEFIYRKKFYEEVCLAIVSDMREEYFEALSQNRHWKARWVRIRGTWSFFAAMGLDRAFAFVSFFVKAWKSVN